MLIMGEGMVPIFLYQRYLKTCTNPNFLSYGKTLFNFFNANQINGIQCCVEEVPFMFLTFDTSIHIIMGISFSL
jgi:hypothetical protein